MGGKDPGEWGEGRELTVLCLCVERSWNMWIPGFGVEERAGQRAPTTEAHKQVGGSRWTVLLPLSLYHSFAADEPCQEIVQSKVVHPNTTHSLPEDTHVDCPPPQCHATVTMYVTNWIDKAALR